MESAGLVAAQRVRETKMLDNFFQRPQPEGNGRWASGLAVKIAGTRVAVGLGVHWAQTARPRRRGRGLALACAVYCWKIITLGELSF